jgi:NADH-quinone oxidoreductase subunit L
MAGILILLVIGLSWLGAIIVWLVGDQRPKAQHWLAFGFSALAGISSLLLLTTIDSRPALDLWFGPAFGSLTFVPDGLAVSLTVIATVIGSLAVLFSMDYMRGEAQLGRYYFLVLFFIGAMAGLVLSGNLLFTFFFWEITALCSYGLISFHNDDPKAVRGGIKALIITQVGGVGLLAGALLAYANLAVSKSRTCLPKQMPFPQTSLPSSPLPSWSPPPQNRRSSPSTPGCPMQWKRQHPSAP